MILYSFRETNRFTKRVERIMDDEDFAELQLTLAAAPKQGVIVPGCGGIRKMRYAATGRGKRGGARVIYYFPNNDEEIYLLDIYAKNEQSDLSKERLAELSAEVKEWRRLEYLRRLSGVQWQPPEHLVRGSEFWRCDD